MKILVVGGASGQVAQSLVATAESQKSISLLALGRPEMDLSDHDSLSRAVDRQEPNIVVNCAAYTQVDKAEVEADLAFAVNRDGAGRLAGICERRGIPFIQLSTDYVFDGRSEEPYCEGDPTNPLGMYGRSKLEGEQAVEAANSRSVILRTAWVHSCYGNNFVKTMLRLAATRETVKIVADQIGCPTYAPHLANLILAAAVRIAKDGEPMRGIFHVAGSGAASWFELAGEVFAQVSALGGRVPELIAIGTAEYPTAAKRPRRSVLNCEKIGGLLGVQLPDWKQGVSECVKHLLTTEHKLTK